MEERSTRERGFTAELWHAIDEIYASILDHPFLRGLTDGTLSDNIGYGEVVPDRARVEQAARQAEAHTFVAVLPGGWDTELPAPDVDLRLAARVIVREELHR